MYRDFEIETVVIQRAAGWLEMLFGTVSWFDQFNVRMKKFGMKTMNVEQELLDTFFPF